MTDIVDRIDELVDAQLEQEASGYDHNINQDRCWHCGGDWHGLAVTERMREMRRFGSVPTSYSYADDDSKVWCPGSTFIGPRHVRFPTAEAGGYEYGGFLPRDPVRMTIRFDATGFVEAHRCAQESLRRMVDQINDFGVTWSETFASGGTVSGESNRLTVRRWVPGDAEMAREREPEPPANPQRWSHLPPLPRPSRRPPMWAARADGRRR